MIKRIHNYGETEKQFLELLIIDLSKNTKRLFANVCGFDNLNANSKLLAFGKGCLDKYVFKMRKRIDTHSNMEVTTTEPRKLGSR